MESYSRVRSIKLKRENSNDSFGFTVRGGQEHGTGIFVSSVTPKSIAHRQGLKTGDQILRVNGYPVSVAIHAECLSLMRVRTNLHLKVRSVGMIPVRAVGEPLTWRLVENIHSATESDENLKKFENPATSSHHLLMSRMSNSSSQPDSSHGQEAKVYINTNGHAGLGCCICRGPPERPGIFVQSTKSSGVARESGLRPGDQILVCNGTSFIGIQFTEAVYYLKSNRELNLVVLKGAGSDLFPGESSGYNSSASSLNGETITTHVSVGSESSATSSPSEQTLDGGTLPKITENDPLMRSTVALDRNMEWDEVEQVWHSAEKESIIIEIKGEDPQERIRKEAELLFEERRKLEEEQKRLLEEAQRLAEEKIMFQEEKRKILEKTETVSLRSSSASSNESVTHHQLHRPNLAGALTNEILKRSERRGLQQQLGQEEKEDLSSAKLSGTTPFTAPVDDVKRQQHEQLIEEFKRAHRKMFAHSVEGESSRDKSPPKEERASFRAKRIQKEVEHARKMVENRVAGIVRQRQLRIERQHQEVQETEREVSKRVTSKGKPKAPPPPPPPPFPVVTSEMTNEKKLLNEEPMETLLNRTTANKEETLVRPASPSPDYSNTPSPELTRRHMEVHENGVVRVSTYSSIYSRPEPARFQFLGDGKSSNKNERDLERAFQRCQLVPTDRIKTNRNGQVTILVNGSSQYPNVQVQRNPTKVKSSGGILKNSNSSGSEHGSTGSGSGNLKSISFGQF